ncbi:O-Antigen ligase [Sphingopyxis flava]|uniref:O-Antigen ligase n=1 Tax=Sphingopyxis flava TaxID=1507287 RepID=A0A1T5F5W6_9SPHN|nr:O-Antigen ligase [Sphingopyxis flava]
MLLTAWIAFQLIPLPPAVWHALPGRETIIEIDRLLGQPDLWRPISLTPSQTWNSLLAMSVPLAALLLAATLDTEDHPRLMLAIVAAAAVSSLLGFFQLLSGTEGAAYLYRITNSGAMVGLFANRNHNAVFLACATVIAAALLRDERMRNRQSRGAQIALVLALLTFTALTALIGSRAGFVAGVAGFSIGYFMLISVWHAKPLRRREVEAPVGVPGIWRFLVYLPPVLLIMLLATVIGLSDRVTALSRLTDPGAGVDMRAEAWPTVLSMIEKFWVTGSGMGSFPDAYEMFEPDALLSPFYFNHAHNDWAEVPLTGGLPMVLILISAVVWVARRFLSIGVRNLAKSYRGDMRLPVLVIMFILAAASLVDYPLRVPSLQVMIIMLITLVCCPASARVQRV